MIPVYYVEDLTIEKVDKLIERGVVFDIASKATVLPKSNSYPECDAFWLGRDKRTGDIRDSSADS